MKQNEPTDPLHIGIISANVVMQHSQMLPNLVKKFGVFGSRLTLCLGSWESGERFLNQGIFGPEISEFSSCKFILCFIL